MGCVPSTLHTPEKEAIARNAKIDRNLLKYKWDEARTVKILLLGK